MTSEDSSELQPITCIIPALNEEKTIGEVIDSVQQVDLLTEILVIDDGSTDGTSAVAKDRGARVIRNPINRGKGAAMKRGVQHAAHDRVLFIDADLESMTPEKVRKLAEPLAYDRADFVKASYDNPSGRTTKLVAKPLLKVLYPFVDLDQPLSGEFGIHRLKFDMENIEDGWGIEIQTVLQAAKQKLRIEQVDIGTKIHKHQDLDALAKQAEEIIQTFLSEMNLVASAYKIVFFDLDETLIVQSNIVKIAKAWGFEDELKELFAARDRSEIPDKEITKALASKFAGKSQEDVNAVLEDIEISKFAQELISHLRHRRYRVRIISLAFSPIVDYYTSKLHVHDYVCPRLEQDENGLFTGELRESRFEDVQCECCGRYICKKKAVNVILEKFGFHPEDAVSIGDGWFDECMFDATGFSIGIGNDKADIRVEQLSEISLVLDQKVKEMRGEDNIFPTTES